MSVLLGSTFVVMSACAANNLTDRSIDNRMSRTSKRALVTGLLPARRVLILSLVLGVAGFVILAWGVNWLTFWLGVVGYLDYVWWYAWGKRHTPHSTLIGTISGAIPIMAGYTGAVGRLDSTALLLGLAMVFWQMVHFYAIGIFRRNDYAAANLPILPVARGVKSTQAQMLVYGFLFLGAILALATFGSLGVVFGLMVGGLGLYWVWQAVKGFSSVKPEAWARSLFSFSLIVLLVFAAGVSLAPKLP